MKCVKTESDLRRLALRSGAEVQMDGQVFNSERLVVDPPPPSAPAPVPPPVPPAPAPPPVEFMTRQDVEQLLAEHERRLFQQFEAMLRSMKEMLTAPPPQPAQMPREWKHDITYSRDGEIQSVRSVSR